MSTGSETSLPLVMSIGEPAGIGPDIALMLWKQAADGVIAPLPPFVLLADADHLKRRSDHMGLDIPIKRYETMPKQAPDMTAALPVLQLNNVLTASPAQPVDGDAAGVVEAITRCVDLVRNGLARGMVTLPINKKSLYDSGFNYPGHTEFLGALAEEWDNHAGRIVPVMMLAGPKLKAVPITIHIPLKEVPSALTQELIVEVCTITERDLRDRFGIEKPRLALAGLNPHAGEGGAIGREDMEIIEPAIAELRAAGLSIEGPLPADTMFHDSARAKYDVAVCMYHDQALIPAKALGFDDSVNVTLGLPFVRTSPDHGTAYAIAGTGKALTDSTLAALRMADVMSHGRET